MAEINIEGAKTSEDEGSLASIRERHRQQRVFTGHPADLAGSMGGDEEEPEGRHVQPPAGGEPPAPGGSPEEKPKSEEPPETPPPKPETQFKYKSQEEAEKAYDEAQRKMHEATERAAKLERENEELRKKTETPPAPSPEEAEQEVARVLDEIDSLDPYADDYQAQRAKLWTKVATLRATPGFDETNLTETVRKVIKEELEAGGVRRRQDDGEQASRSWAIKAAQDAGLDMNEDSYDSLLFWKALERAPMHEGVTLQEQVDFMIAAVKHRKAQQAAARSATTPESQILERGAQTPKPHGKEEDEPRTLGNIREKWRDKRRI